MSEKQKQSTALVWFTKDLRVRDNHSLLKALKENQKTIAVYCFDPRNFSTTKYGFKKTEKFRAKFLIETVKNLRKNLQNYNITLLVFHKRPEFIFKCNLRPLFLDSSCLSISTDITLEFLAKELGTPPVILVSKRLPKHKSKSEF